MLILKAIAGNRFVHKHAKKFSFPSELINKDKVVFW